MTPQVEEKSESHCALCGEAKQLCKSHVVPAFVFRWIKETSATGYLRNFKTPNVRFQDGPHMPLLCGDCEGILSKDEKEFSRKIFSPYVNEELSADGEATGQIPYFEYSEWLLRFVISLNWRLIIASGERDYLTQESLELLQKTTDIWRDFLLRKRNDTGENQTHLFFLQNIAAASGTFSQNISDRINFYLLRSIDFTPLQSTAGNLGIYSKIGPIAFFIALNPNHLKNTPDSRVRMRGKIRTSQKLLNSEINYFIFIDRPNDVFSKFQYSERQKDLIKKSYLNNPQRAQNSLSMRAHEADIVIRQIKAMQADQDEFY